MNENTTDNKISSQDLWIVLLFLLFMSKSDDELGVENFATELSNSEITDEQEMKDMFHKIINESEICNALEKNREKRKILDNDNPYMKAHREFYSLEKKFNTHQLILDKFGEYKDDNFYLFKTLFNDTDIGYLLSQVFKDVYSEYIDTDEYKNYIESDTINGIFC